MQSREENERQAKQDLNVEMKKLYRVAQGLQEQGNYDEAISLYDRLLTMQKNFGLFFYNRGVCYFKREAVGDVDLAIRDCTIALYMKSANIAGHTARVSYLRGQAYLKKNTAAAKEAAMYDFQKVINLNSPHAEEARRQLAQLSSEEEKSEKNRLTK